MTARKYIGLSLGLLICAAALFPSFREAGEYRLGPCHAYFESLKGGAPHVTQMDDTCILYASVDPKLLPLAYLIGMFVLGFGFVFRLAKVRQVLPTVAVATAGVLLAGVIGFAASGAGLIDVFLELRLYAAAVYASLFGLILMWVDKRITA